MPAETSKTGKARDYISHPITTIRCEVTAAIRHPRNRLILWHELISKSKSKMLARPFVQRCSMTGNMYLLRIKEEEVARSRDVRRR